MPPEKNVFGQPLKDGQIVEPTPPQPVDDKKPDAGKPAADDIEKNPLVVELRSQIDKTKKDYGGNLSEQRKTIERLEKRIEALAGKTEEPKVQLPYDKVLRVKDLPKEERDAMSDTEKRLFDENADMKQRFNDEAIKSAQSTKQNDLATTTEGKFDATKGIQEAARKLAEGNFTKETQLIEKFNSLGFDLAQLTAENVEERLSAVISLIPDFKPQKQQETRNGSAVKNSAASTGIDAAIDAALKERQATSAGNYAL